MSYVRVLPADSCRGGDCEVLDLKQHVYVGGELDPLTVGQTQHLVVVQYCVHVLYPEGIHGSITHHPMVVHRSVL